MKNCPTTWIFDQFGQCSVLCGTDTVSVWDTHSPGWWAGGSRATPTPHWGFPVPTHTSKIAIPQLRGEYLSAVLGYTGPDFQVPGHGGGLQCPHIEHDEIESTQGPGSGPNKDPRGFPKGLMGTKGPPKYEDSLGQARALRAARRKPTFGRVCKRAAPQAKPQGFEGYRCRAL